MFCKLSLLPPWRYGCRQACGGKPRVGAGEDLVIAQCCDPQLGYKTSKIPGRQDYQGDVARLRLMVDKINGIKPDLVVWCGDMVQAAAWDQSDMLKQLKRLEVPYVIAPGNP